MKIIIIDTHADAIAARLQQTHNDVVLAGTFTDGDAGIEAIGARLPDVAIVNIDLAGIGSLAEFGQQDQPQVEFIFLSEWATFAYEAFRFGATDFLLQPFQDAEFWQAFQRAAKKVTDKLLVRNAYPLVGNLFPRLRDNRIAIQTPDAIDYVPVWQIVRCQSVESRCQIVLEDNRVIEFPGRFTELEQQLRQYPFQRVNAGCVVNLNQVQQYSRTADQLVLRNGSTVPVSDALRATVLQRLHAG